MNEHIEQGAVTQPDDLHADPLSAADEAGETDDTAALETGGTDAAETNSVAGGGEDSSAGDDVEADAENDPDEVVDDEDDVEDDLEDDSDDADDGDEDTTSGRRLSRTERLEREGEVAADFLERLLDIADLDGDIDVDIDGDRAAVAIVDSEDGRVPRRIVGQDGKVLEALQELTRMAVQAVTGDRSRLMLDVAGYRADRKRVVVGKARDAIKDCKDTGEPQPMTPMPAFERKVVHDEVLAAGLRSESEGAEPRRYVVVLPA